MADKRDAEAPDITIAVNLDWLGYGCPFYNGELMCCRLHRDDDVDCGEGISRRCPLRKGVVAVRGIHAGTG